MARPASHSDPVHWSKDYVEHLRSVHFTLIAIAVGLVVLVLSSKQYNAVSALVQIEEILDLKHHWSPAWMEQFGEQDKSSKLTHENLDTFLYEETHISWKDKGFGGVIAFDNKKGTQQSGRRIEIQCLFPKDNWYVSGLDSSAMKFPETLSGFEDWWESLGKSYDIYIPEKFSDSGTVVDLMGSLKNGSEVSVAGFRTGEAGISGPTIQLSFDPDQKDGLPQNGLTEDGVEPEVFYKAYLDHHQMLKIPILSLARYVVTRDTISRHYHNLQVGEFKNTFADLAKASQATSDLSLEDIKEFMHDEAAKGPEVFEVFGMKFPAGQVTLWGIVLLLSVQLYLFTYLRQLTGKLAANDPGWDVPWIAMDASKLAQLIFFVTLVPLPAAAITLLAFRRAAPLLDVSLDGIVSFVELLRSLDWGRKAGIAALLLPCAASILLAFLSWKCRPQLAGELRASPNANPASEELNVKKPASTPD